MYANSEKRKRWTWSYISHRREDRISYMNLYRKKKSKIISLAEEQTLAHMENRLNFDDIYLYRALTEALLRRATLRAKLAANGGGFSLPDLLPWTRATVVCGNWLRSTSNSINCFLFLRSLKMPGNSA
jgi:hypothetical protein